MTCLKVALLQMASCGTDQAANQSKGEAYCRKAASLGADIALFPEMWNIGYTFFDKNNPESLRAWQARAIDAGSGYVIRFRELAHELNMAIAVTYLEKWDSCPRNTVSLIARKGEIVLTYAKVHTCQFDVEGALTPGDTFPVCSLDTAQGEVNVGAMICYDREFPESARILMLNGAEIILTPNACELEQHRLSQFRTRAYENMVGVAMTNYAHPDANGHSIAYHPVAFGPNEQSNDPLVIEAGSSEGVFIAGFDMDAIRRYREREVWGNAFRRPSCYGALTSFEVAEPFIRKNKKFA